MEGEHYKRSIGFVFHAYLEWCQRVFWLALLLASAFRALRFKVGEHFLLECQMR